MRKSLKITFSLLRYRVFLRSREIALNGMFSIDLPLSEFAEPVLDLVGPQDRDDDPGRPGINLFVFPGHVLGRYRALQSRSDGSTSSLR